MHVTLKALFGAVSSYFTPKIYERTCIPAGDIPPGLGKLTKLKKLSMSDNELSGKHYGMSLLSKYRITRASRRLCE